MKRWVVGMVMVVAMGGLLGLGVAGGCGWSAGQVLKAVWDNRLDEDRWEVKIWGVCARGVPIISEWREWLADKSYIVLLQNSNELRPSGGFMGSYLRIRTRKSGIAEMTVEDIYVPDGKIKGHVDPPYPIQEAFGQGWWRLRDANWEADFTRAAPAIAWFLEQGGEVRPDGIVAINLQLVKKWLRVVGPVRLETYDEVVNDDNLDRLAQKYSAEGFVPGSSQKRDFLGAVAARIQTGFSVLSWRKKMELAKLVWEELNRGEILLWFSEARWQKAVSRLGWSGELKMDRDKDYVYIVEANLGVNKANCCVVKEVDHQVGQAGDRLVVKWRNENVSDLPVAPVFGGRYTAYVRVLRPVGYKLERLTVEGVELEPLPAELEAVRTPLWQGKTNNYYQFKEEGGVVSVGFWVVVEAQKAVSVEVGMRSNREYGSLWVQKQPGAKPYIYQLRRFDGEIASRIIDRSVIIPLK